MLNIAIVDDEKLELEYIYDMVMEWTSANQKEVIIDCFDSGKMLLRNAMIEEDKYNIVLLDVQMEDMDGLKTAKRFRKVNPYCIIIFITSYWENVFDAFKVSAFRYILKSKLNSALPEALDSAMKLVDDKEVFFIYSIYKTKKRVPTRDIIYFESRKRTIQIHVIGEEEPRTFYDTLSDIEEKIGYKDFVRCHQSYIVNSRFISEIVNKQLILKNNMGILPISDRYKERVVKIALKAMR